MNITKREVLFSIVIICVFLIFGLIISNSINNAFMERCQEYNTALQIDGDRELFEYGMRTNVGNAFVYGDLKAVDPVTYEEISGEYSYIVKIEERYTMHTRTVTRTDSNGKTHTSVETYWTWDEVDRWSQHATTITFLGVEFDYGTIEFPGERYITAIRDGVFSDIRYVYYGSPAACQGTIYTNLNNNTISDTRFYDEYTIDEALSANTTNFGVVLFWMIWTFIIVCAVIGFYYIDNHWLEDKKYKYYY